MATPANVSHVYAHLISQLGAAVDDARGAAAAIGREAITAASLAAEATGVPAKAAREIARDLRNRASHAALSVLEIAVAAARVDAYADALVKHDEEHEAARSAAVARVVTEAFQDARSYLENEAGDPELRESSPEAWAASGWDAVLDDEGPEAFAPLSSNESKEVYVTAFVEALAKLKGQ